MLHDAILLETFENEIHGKLQKKVSRCNLELQLALVSKSRCNRCRKQNRTVVCGSSKKVARKVAKKVRYTLQPTCKLPRNAITTGVAREIASCDNS